VNEAVAPFVVDEETEYFVHFTSIIADGFKTLQAKQRVTFELKDTPKGTQAVEVKALK
jgi:CspA family cold shock protein